MDLILDAIARGGAGRAAVVAAARATSDRNSILGRYSIDANGHTTSEAYGRRMIVGGQLVWDVAVPEHPIETHRGTTSERDFAREQRAAVLFTWVWIATAIALGLLSGSGLLGAVAGLVAALLIAAVICAPHPGAHRLARQPDSFTPSAGQRRSLSSRGGRDLISRLLRGLSLFATAPTYWSVWRAPSKKQLEADREPNEK